MSATTGLHPAPRACAGWIKRRGLRAFRSDQRGVVAVEFGLVAVPFLVILFAILETALLFWSTQVLVNAVSNAARTIYTGRFQNANSPSDPNIRAKFKTEVCKHVLGLFPCDAPTVHVDVRRFTPGTSPPAVVDPTTRQINQGSFGYQATGPGDIVLVRVAVEYPIYLSLLNANQTNLANGRQLMMASATFRNEPF